MNIKKSLCLVSSLFIAACGISVTGCAPRNEVLKIYNWGDYINEDLIGEFEDWYFEETNERVQVKYETFDTNETMIMRIETQKADYDLVCPSDYMAERMISSGLAQKVDRTIFDMSEEGLFYDGLAEIISPFDNNNEYFVPYCWGTFGIMYDTDRIEVGSEKAEEMNSWAALWSDEWVSSSGKKRILMKDSVRDAYSLARIYSNTEELSELSNGFTDYNEAYREKLISFFSYIDDEDEFDRAIKEAQDALIEQKKVVCKYEVDDGKNDMLAGTTDAWLGFFWSCDAALIMQETGGDHFYYTVPKEGSNVWLDGWIIPKYAKNVKAANYFLKFINTHEYAAENLEYMGTSMALKSVMEEAREEIESDDTFEDDYFEGFKEMYLEMMFPSAEVLSRCGVMRDFGMKRNTDLDSMWIDVKTM